MEVFLYYEFGGLIFGGGLIHGGAYFRNFTVFYGDYHLISKPP